MISCDICSRSVLCKPLSVVSQSVAFQKFPFMLCGGWMHFSLSDGFKYAGRILNVSHAASRFASGLLPRSLEGWGGGVS